MSESTLERVRALFAELFQLPLEQITPSSSPDTIETWDSMQHLNLVLSLEQQFAISFEPDEIEQMLSVELVADLVAEKLAQIGVAA